MALLALLPACGSGPTTPVGSPATSGTSPAVTTNAAEPSAAAAADGPCALLAAAEVSEVIGAHDGGRSAGDAQDSACSWTATESLASVLVGIGAPGTAPDGTLPESDFANTQPGPNGIRLATGPGIVAEFAIGNRACQLHLTGKGESETATVVRLVGLIRDRQK
ncbi:hypothetical protein ACFOOK_02525 [Micromonospora krabiensis]|uniref:DUF3558 domain-containing protein n=1 Tax=Micromonospora krabiensis TaxID=307121 RepID=UPI0012FD3945|nr:DUF3558 domain-containing protein [Micromonospora krabiensis]